LRIGEAVPPQIRPILAHLGLWSNFEAQGHFPSYRTLSAWGGPVLGSNEFLLFPSQIGWRLDRALFNEMMLKVAQRTATHIKARVAGLAYSDGVWRVACPDGTTHTCCFVIDATGRSAVLARALGQRRSRLDGLIGCFAYASDDWLGDREPIVETFRHGWWYTAAIPGKRRVIACMSDADIIRRWRLADSCNFIPALQETVHIRRAPSPIIGELRVRAAGSQYIERPGSLPTIAVGDAASSFDPISGQGIIKALRSGIFGSYVAADCLRGAGARALERYRSFIRQEFTSYQNSLRDYYALEQRWSDEPFWSRRRVQGPPLTSATDPP
jgi:flavin-dependent dehydrogenase